MDFLTWLVLVNLLPLAAVICVALPRARFIIPWFGLATVVVGTFPAFSSSATLVERGSIGVGLGWLMTTFYGLIGLGIVVGSVRLQPASFVSLGAIAAGLILVASFYAYLPPFNYGPAGMLVFATPGLALVAYGAVLWRRHGFEGYMRWRSASLRLAVALGIVAGFGVVGFLAYQADRSDPPDWAPPLPTPESPAETVVGSFGLRPSWDVEDMVKRSDAVVIGMISRDLGTKQQPGQGDPPKLYYTFKDYEITVEEVLYSEADLPRRIAVLAETGASAAAEGVTVVGDDDIPTLQANERMLLFLESLEGPKFSEGAGRPVPKGFTESTYFRVIIGSQFAVMLPDGDNWKDTRNDQTFTATQLRSAIDRHKADAR